jgi:signal transduction histidine kinase
MKRAPGRLFWKFLLALWLAQLVTTVGVGVLIWIEHRHPPPVVEGEPPPSPRKGPPPHHGIPLPLKPILVGSVVSLVFATLLAWYFAAPIRRLRLAFESAARGELETRIGAAMGARGDELVELGREFDRMASRLQALIETQRRLLHDVSHELRSPLARLQAAAGLMRRQPERIDELAARIELDIGRMDRLVGELLTLARLDEGMVGALDERVDLRELVSEVASNVESEHGRTDRGIEVTLGGACVVRGRYELLYRAVENVVRNAVRHGPAGGVVGIAAESGEGRCRVVVTDRGKGVPEAHLTAIFEPFFRGDDSDKGGYGLGLAITRRVVIAHGGHVQASNRAQGGLQVTLELPAAGAVSQ